MDETTLSDARLLMMMRETIGLLALAGATQIRFGASQWNELYPLLAGPSLAEVLAVIEQRGSADFSQCTITINSRPDNGAPIPVFLCSEEIEEATVAEALQLRSAHDTPPSGSTPPDVH